MSGLAESPSPGREIWVEQMAWVPGGSANVAVAAARLGLDVAFETSLGTDPAGEFCYKFLQNESIELFLDRSQQTPVTVAMDQNGDRAMVTYQPGIRSNRSGSGSGQFPAPPSGEAENRLPAARVIIDSARGDHWWASAAASGTTVILDPHDDPQRRWRLDDLARSSDGAQVLTPNLAEARAYTGCTDLRQAARILHEIVPTVVITDGQNGAHGIDREGRFVHVPGIRVPALDTTGAGDVFAAGLACGLIRNYSLEQAIGLGVLASGISTTRLGGSAAAPTWQEIGDWLAAQPAGLQGRFGYLHSS